MVLVVRCLICNKELNYEKNDPSELILHVQQEHPQIRSNSRKSNQNNSAKQEGTEKILNKSLTLLKSNSISLNSLIDNETQTDIVWSKLFKKKMSQQQPGPSRDSHRDMTETPPKTSKESVLSDKKSLQPREVVSSPSRFSDTDRKFNERTPLKNSTPIKTSLLKNIRQGDRVQLQEAKVLYTREKEESESPKQEKLFSANQKKVKFYKTSIERWRPVGNEKIHCPRCQAHKRPIVRTHKELVTESSFTTTVLMTCWPLCMSPCLFPEPTQENLHCPVCNYHLGVYNHVLKVVKSNPELSQ